MDWEDFHHDHHRPHVLIVSIESEMPSHALAKADFDLFVVRLGAIGNYTIKTEGTTTHIAFEHDADADRLAAVAAQANYPRNRVGVKVVGAR